MAPSDQSPDPAERPQPQIFRRVLEPPKRMKLPYVLGAVVLLLAAVALAAYRDPDAYQVVTLKGIKTVNRDMSRSEVGSILGTPLMAGQEDGCVRYGNLKMDAVFTIYVVCYDKGRVTRVSEERFETHRIDPPPTPEPEPAPEPVPAPAP